MIDMRLDANHDIDITNAQAWLITGDDEVAQDVDHSLQLFLGESFMDPSDGLPFFDRILVRNVNEADVFQIYQSYILARPGIATVDDLQLERNRETRELDIFAKATTISGAQIEVDTTIGV